MIVSDGKWVMEGKSDCTFATIKSWKELSEFIEEIGFIPLFKNNIEGFSVEELTDQTAWFGENSEIDPWCWREVIAARGEIAYGKLFNKKAGFISREWYPLFTTYRRDGYDFDSRYEDGLASIRDKKIMEVIYEMGKLPSHELKSIAGFHKGGEKGFDSTITNLQMQTYLTVREFRKKLNKSGEEYGWPAAVYSSSEDLFGKEYVTSFYQMEAREAREKIVSHVSKRFTGISEIEIEKCIR